VHLSIDEVDLLHAAQALADFLGTHFAHAFDALELRIANGEQLLESTCGSDDVRDNQFRQSRDETEDPVAARRYRMVDRVDLAVVTKQLREAAEVK